MSKFGDPQPPLQINFEVHRIARQKERPEPQGWAWEGDVFNVSVRLQYTTHELQELARGLAVQRQQGELLSYYREELALLSGRRELPQAVEHPASLLPDRRRCLQHEVADEALQRHRGEQVLELPCNGEGLNGQRCLKAGVQRRPLPQAPVSKLGMPPSALHWPVRERAAPSPLAGRRLQPKQANLKGACGWSRRWWSRRCLRRLEAGGEQLQRGQLQLLLRVREAHEDLP